MLKTPLKNILMNCWSKKLEIIFFSEESQEMYKDPKLYLVRIFLKLLQLQQKKKKKKKTYFDFS